MSAGHPWSCDPNAMAIGIGNALHFGSAENHRAYLDAEDQMWARMEAYDHEAEGSWRYIYERKNGVQA